MLGALAFDPRPGPWLTRALVAEDFEFYGRTLTGAQQLRDRWKRGVSLVENLMGDAVGKLYVQRHFRRMPSPASTPWWTTCRRRIGSASASWIG